MVRLKKGDRILLLSDGVWGETDEKIIEHIAVSADNPSECTKTVINTVLSGRAEDNASVIVVDYL